MNSLTITEHVVIEIPEILFETGEDNFTIVHCSYWSSNMYVDGGWVTIWKSTYLVNASSVERVELLHAINIPVSPVKHYFKRQNEFFPFTLIFPKIPDHWQCFDLIEKTTVNSGFEVKNIKKNKNHIYRVTVI